MREYPKGYVIPLGAGQRSDPEANRLVDWLLENGIQVEELKQGGSYGGQTFDKGSYVVWMTQAHRGLADTALSIGTNISGLIQQLYAPPGAWSHGFLWGADTLVIPRDADFSPVTNRVTKASHLLGGVEPGAADAYVLAIDSPTAVRTLNALLAGGTTAQFALTSFASPAGETLPAGSVIFAGRPGDEGRARACRSRERRLVPPGVHRRPPDEGADRPLAPNRRADRCGEPGRLVAPEPRLHGRPGLDGGRSTRLRPTRSRTTTSSSTPLELPGGVERHRRARGSRPSSLPAAATSAPARAGRAS